MDNTKDNRFPLAPGTLLTSNEHTYEINDISGYGGTSIVYRGKILDGQETGTIVIIKELYPYDVNVVSSDRNADGSLIINSPEMMKHYMSIEKKNFELAKGLTSDTTHNNPHAWHYRDFFECNNTSYTICLETNGFTLDDGIKKGIIPCNTLAECIQIILHILPALKVVHNAQKVHCDIKPSNIWVVNTAPSYYFRMLDFGSAIEVGENAKILSATYDYAAPEILFILENSFINSSQTTFKHTNISATEAVDIYSVIAILYNLVTGKSVQEYKFDYEFERSDGWIFNVSDEALNKLNLLFNHGLHSNPSMRPSIDKLQKDLEGLLSLLRETITPIYFKPITYRECMPYFTDNNLILSMQLANILEGSACYLSTTGPNKKDYYYAAAKFAGFCAKNKKFQNAKILPIAYMDSLEKTLLNLSFGCSEESSNERILAKLRTLAEDYYILVLGYKDSPENSHLLERITLSQNFYAHFVLCGESPGQKNIEKIRNTRKTTKEFKDIPNLEGVPINSDVLQYVFSCKSVEEIDKIKIITDLGIHETLLLSLPGVSKDILYELLEKRILYSFGGIYYYNPLIREELIENYPTDFKLVENMLNIFLETINTENYFNQNQCSITSQDFRLVKTMFLQLPCTEGKCNILSTIYAHHLSTFSHSEIVSLYEEHFNLFIGQTTPDELRYLANNYKEYAKLFNNIEDRRIRLEKHANILYEITKHRDWAVNVNYKNKQYDKVIEDCNWLIEIYSCLGTTFNSKIATYYYVISKSYERKDMRSDSIKAITRAIELQPDNLEFIYQRADMNHLYNLEAAKKDYKYIKSKFPYDYWTNCQLVRLKISEKEYDEAIEICKFQIENFNHATFLKKNKYSMQVLYTQLLFNLGDAYFYNKQYDNASLVFKKLELEHDNVFFSSSCAGMVESTIAIKNGNLEKALYFAKITHDFVTCFSLYKKIGDYQNAKSYFEPLLLEAVSYWAKYTLSYIMGKISLYNDNCIEAIAYFLNAIENFTKTERTKYYSLDQICSQLNLACKKISHTNSNSLLSAVKAYSLAIDFQCEDEIFDYSLRTPNCYLYRAQCLEALGRHSEAEADYERYNELLATSQTDSPTS